MIISNILAQFRRSQGIKDTLVTIVGNTLGTGLSAIALILISRLLGPTDFGVFSVGFAIVLILTRVNELGLNTVLLKLGPNMQDVSSKQALFNFVLRYKLAVSLVFVIVGIISYRSFASFINFSHPTLLLTAFLLGLATVYYEHLLTILQTLHLFRQAVAINALQAAVKLIGALIFFWGWQPSVLFVFAWYVAAPLVPVLFSHFFLPTGYYLTLWSKKLVDTAKIWTLARHTALALIAAGIIENIDILFLQKYLSSYETGLYGGITRIALLFTLIAYSLGNVLNPRVARYKAKIHLQPYLRKAFALLMLAVAGFLIFIPLSPWMINLTIGPEYLSGTTILLIMTAASFVTIASMPFIALFYSYESNWYFSLSGLLQLTVVIIGNLVFVPEYGLEAAAWTRLASRLVLFVFTFIVGLSLYQKNYAHH